MTEPPGKRTGENIGEKTEKETGNKPGEKTGKSSGKPSGRDPSFRVASPPSQAVDVAVVLDPLPIAVQKKRNASTRVKPVSQKKGHAESSRPLYPGFQSFLIPFLLAFLVGSAISASTAGFTPGLPGIGLPLVLLLTGIVLFNLDDLRRGRFKIRAALWLIAFLLGAVHYQHAHFRTSRSDVANLAPLPHAGVMGIVEEWDHNRRRMVLKASQVNDQSVTGRVLVTLPDTMPAPPPIGARALVQGHLLLPFHSSIPGVFDQEKYLHNRQITALLKTPERLETFETQNSLQYALFRLTEHWKGHIANMFSRALPSPQSDILAGLVLGDKAVSIDQDTRQAFIQTGLIHILAASGMNVGIIAGAALFVLSRLRVLYRPRYAITMAVVAFYCLLTGLPPSILRAGVMLETALFLKLLNRRLSPTLLLCLAGTLLVLWNVDIINNIGFQFSMLTTLGLFVMLPPLQEKLGYYITRWAAGLLLIPIIAQLWIWPLSVYYFNQFPVHALPLNLLAIMLVTPLTLIGFVSAAVGLLIPVVGGWIAWLALPLLSALLAWVHWGNGMSWAKWTLPSPSGLTLLLFYVELAVYALLLTCLPRTPPIRKLILALVPLSLLAANLYLEKQAIQSHTHIDLLPLSIAHEGYLIQPQGSPDKLLVIPETLSYFESRDILSFLKHRNITRLAAIILMPDNLSTGVSNQPVNPDLGGMAEQLLAQIPANVIVAGSASLAHLQLPQNKPPASQIIADRAELSLGPFSMQIAFPALRILSREDCLLEILPPTVRALPQDHCALQAHAAQLNEPVLINPLDNTLFYYHFRHTVGQADLLRNE